jgi:hypothetical protein
VLWSRNTQLHYPFQNTANDYSGNARHGTVHGSGVYATKPNGGRCLYFDGVGDYVSTPSFGLSGSVVVFAADVRCKFHLTTPQMFMSGPLESATVGSLLPHRTSGTNYLTWGYANGAALYVIDPDYFFSPFNDTWLHLLIAADYSGKKVYFYRNGALHFTGGMQGIPLFPSTNTVKDIGSYGPNLYTLTDGYLANIYLGTLAARPPVAVLTANANRLMLGLNPIW